jgi:hypothetical protein
MSGRKETDSYSIHAGFPIGGNSSNHNAGFAITAGTEFAYKQSIVAGKTLALTALEVLRNETLAKAMWEEFEAMKEGL